MIDLGTLGGTNSYAYGINSDGQVVGASDSAGSGWRAFLYSGGIMTDLNSLIDPSSGWFLSWADDINDSGQIVGTGFLNGQEHAFLLTPTAVPIPATVWLFGSGLLGLLGIVRGRRNKQLE